MQPQSNQTEEILEPTSSPTFKAESAPAPAAATLVAMSDTERQEREILLRRLRRKGSFRESGASLFDTDEVDSRKFAQLLRLLQDPNPGCWKERILAAGTLGCASLKGERKQSAAQTLGEVLGNTEITAGERVLSRLAGSYGIAYLIAFSMMVVFSAYPLFLEFDRHGSESVLDFLGTILLTLLTITMGSGVLALLFYPFVSYAYAAVAVSRQNRIRAAAATALGRIGQPESVGVMARAWFDMRPTVRKAAHEALPTLLLSLTPDHYGHLTSDLTPNLCRALRQEARKEEPTSEAHALALLQALERVGDGRAVEPVQALTNPPYPERIQREAEKALLILEARRQQENDSKSLLRGAATPETKSGELLRAAVNFAEEKPEQLLRIPFEEGKNTEGFPD